MRSASPIEIHPTNGLPYGISSTQATVLAEAIKAGNFVSTACKIAGVNFSTFQDWMVRGGDPDSDDKDKPAPGMEVEPYKSFCKLIRSAEAIAEQTALTDVRNAGKQDWRASAWFLSRRNNVHWGEKNTGVQVATTGAVQFFLPNNNRDNPIDERALPESLA